MAAIPTRSRARQPTPRPHIGQRADWIFAIRDAAPGKSNTAMLAAVCALMDTVVECDWKRATYDRDAQVWIVEGWRVRPDNQGPLPLAEAADLRVDWLSLPLVEHVLRARRDN